MIYILVPLLIIADQLTKIWSFNKFYTSSAPDQYVGLGFYFTAVKNTGAAFGILQDNTLALGILSLLVSAFLILFLVRNHNNLNRISHFALVLILSGAIGNMIDRLYLGYVRDFIHFSIPNFSFAVFNVADSCVVIGAILLFLANLRPSKELQSSTTEVAEAEIQETPMQAFSTGETHPVTQPDEARL